MCLGPPNPRKIACKLSFFHLLDSAVIRVKDEIEIDEDFYGSAYPEKNEDFIRPANRGGHSSAEPSIQKTTIHMEGIEAMLNG